MRIAIKKNKEVKKIMKKRKGTKKCEIKYCREANLETEIVSGHPLTLCSKHGPDWGKKLTWISPKAMAEWARTHLCAKSARKWN